MPFFNFTLTFIFLSTLISTFIATASPHPGMGSSALNQVEKSAVFSMMGFRLNTVPSGWNFISGETYSDITKNFQIDLGKSSLLTADHSRRISFKMETTKTKIDLETYVKKFLRDYNQYGFEVSGLQSLHEKNSVIIDLNQKNKKTRSRQMFFQNGTRIVIATCIDEFESFEATIAECNQIFNGLNWR